MTFIDETPVSKQALSKARMGLNPEFVRKFANGIAEIQTQDANAPSYLGMRLIVIDGTDIALENSDELKKSFVCSGPKRNAATALGSLAYGTLVLLRRISGIYQNMDFFYLLRVRKKWNLQVDAVQTEGRVTLSHENQDFQVRVLKVKIPGGETEPLLTNLPETLLPRKNAAELYFKRWAVETAFDTLKSKLQLENFSGKTEVSVRQDFYATVYLAGFAMICAEDADKIIEEQDRDKQLKYRRKSNLNRSIDCLRTRFYRQKGNQARRQAKNSAMVVKNVVTLVKTCAAVNKRAAVVR